MSRRLADIHHFGKANKSPGAIKSWAERERKSKEARLSSALLRNDGSEINSPGGRVAGRGFELRVEEEEELRSWVRCEWRVA